ncbi:MAG TPA: hypothetical protein HPP83_02755 [Candidatus Hydrogenedentes bacterium]|nr:hypothetical protein [Candidatus Hydrogenedentota bacterium]
MEFKAHVGLMPFYLKLYDGILPDLLSEMAPLTEQAQQAFAGQGIRVTCSPVCRMRPDCENAIHLFTEREVDLIVTLHLTYSPSLEAADALCGSGKPVLMLDTTLDKRFGRDADPERMLFNHGIHGVQDLASVLRRRGKPFWIVAGHLTDPRAVGRAASVARFARAANKFKNMRVLQVGASFPGMGDFLVDESLLQDRFGIEVERIAPRDLAQEVQEVGEEEIAQEVQLDRERFAVDIEAETHRRAVRVGLGLRRCVAKRGCGAVTLNFAAFESGDKSVDVLPFLECCKCMACGIGYAGEGDVPTASLVSALLAACPETSFTEMFCADWEGNSLFLSHMGEFNPTLACDKPRLFEKGLRLGGLRNPACLACAPRPGPATLVNLAPGSEDTFQLTVAPVEVLEDGTHEKARDWIRAWIRSPVPVSSFLERYSVLGGTHHSAIILGDHVEGLRAFAAFTGMERCTVIV